MKDQSKHGVVGGLARLIPYVWPYRKRLLLSAFFALMVGVFWGLNLSVAFPIVKIVGEGQSLQAYVISEVDQSQKQVDDYTEALQKLDLRLAELGDATDQQSERRRIDLLQLKSRTQSKLSSASRSLMLMTWLDQTIMRRLPDDQFDVLALILALLLIATVLKGTFIFLQDVLTGNVVELSIMGLRKDCYRKVLQLDYQTIQSQGGTPGLMSKFTFDINVLTSGLQLIGGKFLREPLKAACCIVLAFMVNWRLTLLSLVFVPFAGYLFYRFGRSLKKASHRMMESMSRICKTLEETFDSIKIVTAFGRGRRHRSRFHRENKEYFSKAMKIVRIDALTSPTIELFGLAAIFTVLLPGMYLVLRGTDEIWNIKLSDSVPDIANLTLLYVILIGVLDPLRKLSKAYSLFKRSSAAAERIFELVDTESLVKEHSHPIEIPRLTGQIEFKNIFFAYHRQSEDELERPMVLNDVSLRVRHGETIVVVGENGSGKSTLVNLLPRFYDPERGEILIDGIDTRRATFDSLRAQMAVVTQETLLFDETIFSNIQYGNPDATHEEVLEAARRAHVTQFLDKLPDGMNTVVGEKGSKLSGGQRQRISLARAIVRNPAIMILDEATSAIDSQSERLIHSTLTSFLKGRTAFIITHSVTPSILEFTSRIVVMDHGQLVAQGTHQELITGSPHYQRLYHAHRQSEAA
ncbi:MAG TPA: ABC transporter ATP-binding protein [Planctomycetaceae bacterium]|nr:ABC transporter ATP-binding protein [Planctomycetaceae bacterium]